MLDRMQIVNVARDLAVGFTGEFNITREPLKPVTI